MSTTKTATIRRDYPVKVRDNVTRVRELMARHAEKDDVLALMNLLRIGPQVTELWEELRKMWGRMDDGPREPQE